MPSTGFENTGERNVCVSVCALTQIEKRSEGGSLGNPSINRQLRKRKQKRPSRGGQKGRIKMRGVS